MNKIKSLGQSILQELSPSISAALLIYLESRLEILMGTRECDPNLINHVRELEFDLIIILCYIIYYVILCYVILYYIT